MSISIQSIERLLDDYDLEDLLDYNQLTVADAVFILVEDGHIQLPDCIPVDMGE